MFKPPVKHFFRDGELDFVALLDFIREHEARREMAETEPPPIASKPTRMQRYVAASKKGARTQARMRAANAR